MNLYIKSLRSTKSMSDSEQKTPTISPDQGATGETAKLKRWIERESQSPFLKIMRKIKELVELFHDLQQQEHDELLQDMELFIKYGVEALFYGWLTGTDKEKDKVTEKNN